MYRDGNVDWIKAKDRAGMRFGGGYITGNQNGIEIFNNDEVDGGSYSGIVFDGPNKVISATAYKIQSSVAPTQPNDLANKEYVDSKARGGDYLPLAGGTMKGDIDMGRNDIIGVDNIVGGGGTVNIKAGSTNHITVSGTRTLFTVDVDMSSHDFIRVNGISGKNTKTDGAYIFLAADGVEFRGKGEVIMQARNSACGFLMDMNMHSHRITSLADPSSETDAVNKRYVDSTTGATVEDSSNGITYTNYDGTTFKISLSTLEDSRLRKTGKITVRNGLIYVPVEVTNAITNRTVIMSYGVTTTDVFSFGGSLVITGKSSHGVFASGFNLEYGSDTTIERGLTGVLILGSSINLFGSGDALVTPFQLK